jgi:hypothetical protein
MARRLTPQDKVLRAMSEQDLVDKTLQLAEMCGWWWHHTRPVWTPKGFKTPLGGMVGFPDYVLARTTGRVAFVERSGQNEELWRHEVLFVEFKRETAGYGPGQEEWARRLGPQYRLWRPSSWPEIEATLTGRKNLQELTTVRPSG